MTGPAGPAAAGPADGPLAGVRVLELGNYIAAPFAGMVFADFGADVIKVERPGRGDELRGWRAPRGDTSMLFRTLGRGKRSLTLDLSTPDGQALVRGLVRECDAVIENFRPGTLERWGIGPDALTAVNPDLVLVRISGYGQDGPYRDRAGFGGVAEAFGGLRSVTGYPDRPPVRSAASVGDEVAGLYGVIGALALLLAKARGGPRTQPPPVVDVALYEAVFGLMDSLVPDYEAYGTVRERTGAVLPDVVPNGLYACADGQQIVVGGNANGVFHRFMAAIGRDDLAADPDLAGPAGRADRAAELDEVIRDWTAAHPAAEVLAVLDRAGVPAGPVLDAAGIAADPHYRARDMLVRQQVPVGGQLRSVRFPGVVPRLGRRTPPRLGPELGEHTDAVLTGLLGLSGEDLAGLRARAVI